MAARPPVPVWCYRTTTASPLPLRTNARLREILLPKPADMHVHVHVHVDEAVKDAWDGEGVAGMLVKSDDERRYTLTVAYPANKPDIGVAKDGFQDFASKTVVEEAAWNYMLKSRNVGAWHEGGTDGSGEVVESYIYRGPDWAIKSANGEEVTVTSGDWLMGIIWAEDSFTAIKEGRATGVSMQGKVKRRTPSPLDLANLRRN